MKNRLIKSVLIWSSLGLIILGAIKVYEYKKNKPLCENCNILLISLDTLSAKHLPCYGYDKNTSPNLCQFGKDNILFSNSYSQSHWSRPSQTSVLTGLYPTTHGVLTPFIDKLSPKFMTIQEELKGHGYTTYYYGPKVDNVAWDDSVIRNFDHNEQNIYNQNSIDNWQKALDILEENRKNKTPTFVFLHTYYVHAPYITGEKNLKFIKKEDKEKYPEIPLIQDDFNKFTPGIRDFVLTSLNDRVKNSKTKESLKLNTEMLDKMKSAKTLAESERAFNSLPQFEIDSYKYYWYIETLKGHDKSEYINSLYDERISQLDKDLEKFFERIKNNFSKDTIVIVYSDHGETLGERGSYVHCESFPDCLYMETVKVPLIIRVPGLKSKKIDELAQGIDIYPTIMKLVGIRTPDYLEGEDLVELITGKQKKSKKEFVFSESDKENAVLIDKRWSLYVRNLNDLSSDHVELYDLNNDKNQQTNVAQQNPKVVMEKIDILKNHMNRSEKQINIKHNFPDWIDEVKKEKLIKEGYF